MQTVRKIRMIILIFMICLLLSGITAIPVATELNWILVHVHFIPAIMQQWFSKVYTAVTATNDQYPFLQYGNDWLAFAHIMIALAFIGPLRDPVKNKWVIDWGIICCVATIPVVLIAGPQRGIPWFHMLADCLFGVIGIFPLLYVKRSIKRMELLQQV